MSTWTALIGRKTTLKGEIRGIDATNGRDVDDPQVALLPSNQLRVTLLINIDDQVASCRRCGCTDGAACFPSCWWVEDDLCSSCTPSELAPAEAATIERFAINTTPQEKTA